METVEKLMPQETEIMLRLSRLREEQHMRSAWDWFATRFFPDWAEAVRDVLTPGHDHQNDLKNVVAYSDAAASLLLRGIPSVELFVGAVSDVLLPWVRMGRYAEYVRHNLQWADFLINVEQLASVMPRELEHATSLDETKQRSWHVQIAEPYLRRAWARSEAEQEEILKDYAAVCLHTLLAIPSICNLEFAVRHIIENNLAGAYVECGVWRGGSASYWARSFLRNGGDPDKVSLFCFDSFQGMPRITLEDGDSGSEWLYGRPLSGDLELLADGALVPTGPTLASESDCRKIVEASGFRKDHIHVIRGWFQHTLPDYKGRIGPIAVLRLDSDFYEATKFCLETLYDNVLNHGVIIIDDYEGFGGCRKAVDQFVAALGGRNLVYYGDFGRFFFKE